MNLSTSATGLPARSGSFSGWRLMFRLAGVFNIAVAIPLWFAPVTGDLVWAYFFWRYLRTHPEQRMPLGGAT
jgi:hypothetical protein